MTVLVTVGALLLLAMVLALARQGRVSRATAADIQQGMIELAPEAVAHAKSRYELTLDYTPESVERVEAALGRIHDEVAVKALAPSQAHSLAVRYGAYVGESIRRAHGGTWAKDHVAAGPNSFPLALEGHDIFPVGWCIRRVANGPEDNVWHKYLVSVVNRDSIEAAK